MDEERRAAAFTAGARALQERAGSRASYARLEARRAWERPLSPALTRFIAARDSFYLGTASADARPYVQHRGGPRGFLRVLGERTLGFADFSGNRQYISAGNLAENEHAFLFVIDHASRRRIKLWGRARVVEGDAELLSQLVDPSYPARVERAIVLRVDAWDENCSAHVPVLYDETRVEAVRAPLEARIAELERENAALRARVR